jgi:hypothetical protein
MSVAIARALTYFMDRVEFEQNSGCWLWSGPLAAGGYGCVVQGKRGRYKAHRVSWFLFHGDTASGLKVCHRCDTPLCVNPAHLFIGTQADNVADMMAKGRHRAPGLHGERNPMARLSASDAERVRQHVQAGGTQRAIAKQLGVSPMTVCRVVNGQTWRQQ